MLLISNIIVNCVWSNWTEGVCSEICGVPGKRVDTRAKIVEEKDGGTCDCNQSSIQLACNKNKTCPLRKFII